MAIKAWKWLESFVAEIEHMYSPQGVDVRKNVRKYRNGKQIAEFDVHVTGQLGSVKFYWIFECRDRKSKGDAKWIQACSGRKLQFSPDRVIAVSTSEFTAGAEEAAKASGIELRRVQSLSKEAPFPWVDHNFSFTHVEKQRSVKHVTLDVDCRTPEQFEAVSAIFTGADRANLTLRRSANGELVPLRRAAEAGIPDRLFDGLQSGAPPVRRSCVLEYTNPLDCFELDSPLGSFRVRRLLVSVDVQLQETQVAIKHRKNYVGELGRELAQVIVSDPFTIEGREFQWEMHSVPGIGTNVLLRVVDDAPRQRQPSRRRSKKASANHAAMKLKA